MTQTSRTIQQIEWLGELYPALVRVAQAIIPESVTTAEDLTSDAVLVILTAVNGGRCTITARSRFASYCKNMVRKKARNAFTRYHGDIKIDRSKSHVLNNIRSDRRRTAPHKPDGDAHNPHERWETVKPE